MKIQYDGIARKVATEHTLVQPLQILHGFPDISSPFIISSRVFDENCELSRGVRDLRGLAVAMVPSPREHPCIVEIYNFSLFGFLRGRIG